MHGTKNRSQSDKVNDGSGIEWYEVHILIVLQCTASGQLSGNEDMSILHGFIAYLPSAVSFSEVKKFKRRPRYLEFFVQVAKKGLVDGNAELVIGWCTDAEQVLVK